MARHLPLLSRPSSPFARPSSRSEPAPRSPMSSEPGPLVWPKHCSEGPPGVRRMVAVRDLTGDSNVTLGDLARIAGVRSDSAPTETGVLSSSATRAFEQAIEAQTGMPAGGRLMLETPGGTREVVASPSDTLVEKMENALQLVEPSAASVPRDASAPLALYTSAPSRPSISTASSPVHLRATDPSPASSGALSSDPSPTPSSQHPASQAAPTSPATLASGSFAASHSPQRTSPTFFGAQPQYWPGTPFTPPPGSGQYAYHTRLYAPAYPYPAPQGGFPPPQPMPSSPMAQFMPVPPSPSSSQAPPSPYGASPQLVYPGMPTPTLYYDQYGRAIAYSYEPSYDPATMAQLPVPPQTGSAPATPFYGGNYPPPTDQYGQAHAQAYPYSQQTFGGPPSFAYYPAAQPDRSQFAQGRPHDLGYNHRPPMTRVPDHGGSGGRRRNVMPRPPAHSEFAMWVGNVPADSNHAELWRFFTTRPGPPASAVAHDSSLAELLSVPGVESIHLISRSNCAFVNYSTAAHLEHAIRVCHNVPLRPGDPRTMGKDLVCRIRRKDDDTKTGVGAQRAPGQRVHHQWVQQHGGSEAGMGAIGAGSAVLGEDVLSPPVSAGPGQDSFLNARSASTASTTSSFLMRHFPRRYFILKSHTEEDLNLSVERGVWATQSHNEPVLDQAYRTSRDGVFLIFSANRTGAFFGYARMDGPILSDEQRQASGSSMRTVEPVDRRSHSPIPEHDNDFEQDKIRRITDRLASSSPQPASPLPSPAIAVPHDSHPPISAHSSTPARGVKPSSLAPPAVSGRRAESLDPRTLASMRVIDPQVVETAVSVAPDVSAWRRESGMTTAEERNARLELLDSFEGGPSSSQPIAGAAAGRGHSFRIEWLKVQRLSFQRTKHLRNPFNLNREVKVSRDGTELEPAAGEALLRAFDEVGAGPPTPPIGVVPASPRMSDGGPTSFSHSGMPQRPSWATGSANPNLPPRMR